MQKGVLYDLGNYGVRKVTLTLTAVKVLIDSPAQFAITLFVG
jgi:hypothetical protein